MCGICGQFNFASDEPVEPTTIRRMTDTIAHRGPDDEGYFISGPIGLGFRRLSIIDLAGGHQPMFDAERSVCVVFNGEIYNYRELRVELENCGHRFQTNCDTEVIVHGYKEWRPMSSIISTVCLGSPSGISQQAVDSSPGCDGD